MGLLLAAALAAHIQTGSDLLHVCKHQVQTCDAYIGQLVAGDVECVYTAKEVRNLRKQAIKLAARNRNLPAEHIVWQIQVSDKLCEADGGQS